MSYWVLETIGYVGSVLVAISLMMSNLKHLRWINLVGAAIFSSYGFLIQAWPVFALNGWIALVNIYYLVKMYRSREKFNLIEMAGGMSNPVVRLFVSHYRKDIGYFYPELDLSALDECYVWLTYRDLRPAGVFVFRQDQALGNCTRVELDYAAPEYRDMKNAKVIMTRQIERLNGIGTHMLVANSHVKSHQDYLRAMGFVSLDDNHEFQRVISSASKQSIL